ncbi:MAG TPA: iron ABC transporter permease [Gemmatimonadales bacterium]|jgi:iron complex transport system permease protein|nr:iron ABC transporter permease [Gemmatimonadales bacterium]
MLSRLTFRQVYLLLAVALAGAVVMSAAIGDFIFTPRAMVRFVGQALHLVPLTAADALDRNVFFKLRLPRVLLGTVTGAVLGVSGTLMQGLFRNPIVEPGLAGTSAGAAFGAALVFVLGGHATLAFTAPLGSAAVPVLAFAGGFAATVLVYRVSTSFGKVNVFTMLLAGIAVNAVCAAGTGFLSYIARDPQARNITFWNLGTFTTADWPGALLVTATFLICCVFAFRYGKALNALMLGEDEAAYTGLDPRRFTWGLLVVNTLMVAVATAMVGVIAFIGLVVPHLLRMLRSSDYTFLLPASALLGAVLMEVIDTVARLVIAPAELPIGIITAVVGAPIFIWILMRQQRRGAAGYFG